MRRDQLSPYLALGLVAPGFAVVYALWFGGAVADGAQMTWLVPVLLLTVVGAARIRNASIQSPQLRTGFWAVVIGQVAGTVSGSIAASSLRDGGPLWAVAGVSLLLLAAWAWFAVAKSRPQPSAA